MGHAATVAIDSAKDIEALQQLDTQRKEHKNKKFIVYSFKSSCSVIVT